MSQPEWLASFTSRRTLAQFLSDVLLLGLLMLVDGWILVRLARQLGVYLALAIQASVAVVAVIVVGSTINRQIRTIRAAARAGTYRPIHYAQLATSVVSAVLLVLPGFATDAVGAVLYFPPGRYLFVWWFLRRNAGRLPVVYEYLKLSVFSDDDEPANGGPGERDR